MSVLAAALSAALFAAAPTGGGTDLSPTEKPTELTGVNVKPGAKDRIICRSEGVSGSRLGGKRVCLTKDEWEQRSADAKKNLMDRQARTTAPRAN